MVHIECGIKKTPHFLWINSTLPWKSDRSTLVWREVYSKIPHLLRECCQTCKVIVINITLFSYVYYYNIAVLIAMVMFRSAAVCLLTTDSLQYCLIVTSCGLTAGYCIKRRYTHVHQLHCRCNIIELASLVLKLCQESILS